MINSVQSDDSTPKKVGIIGGGKGGAALLQALLSLPQVEVMGICDIDPQAPAIELAKARGIATYADTGKFIGAHSMDWLINVADRSMMQRHILSRELSGITLIDGHIAELIWRMLIDFSETFSTPLSVGDAAALSHLQWTLIQRIVSIAQPVQRELEYIAFHDPLTGLYSRHMLSEFTEREISHAYRQERTLSMVVMDIDHFKHVNDTFGHNVGDVVLRELAQLLSESCRRSDMVARYGGEEFVVVLTNTNLQSATMWAERMRAKTADSLRVPDGTAVTISLGVASIEFDGDTDGQNLRMLSSDDLFKQADKMLYQAKKAGRNRVAGVRLKVQKRSVQA